MSSSKNLYEIINIQKEELKNDSPDIFEIPNYISENLKYPFFEWQRKAFENFLFYENPKSQLKIFPTHLMFNMATGTGKTLLIAAAILYYYRQGYRHFIFFVNQNNIVDKTENNFINNSHTKYLFKEKIVIDDKIINIKKVDVFSEKPHDIEIKFTTIQKLYNDIHVERENQTTIDDLYSKNIVMLADEAHHLNTDTNSKKEYSDFFVELKKNTSIKDVEKKGWEHTVIELIFNKNGKEVDNKNVLLEFTATIPATVSIFQKYKNKIIYQFGLKEFLRAGYTKEINLISSNLEKKERVLQALLFQWYRHKIAIKNGIANFKPVILFRSKTIEESKADYEDFLDWMDNLTGSDFDFLQSIYKKIQETEPSTFFSTDKSRTEQVVSLIKKEKIDFIEIAEWIKQSYKKTNIIITNSKTNKAKKEKTDEQSEKLLNSLEDKNNHIRAIFTVNRLTEGWDVLNLFDIVRLYDGRDEIKYKNGNRKAGNATISEKQLIGRGVRYFPFSYKNKIKHKRKFDKDLNHELRILEELYFYSTSDHRYIDELKRELKKDGYLQGDSNKKIFSIEKDSQEGKLYKKTKVLYNNQTEVFSLENKTLDDIKKDFFMQYKIKGMEFNEQEIDLESHEDLQRLNLQENKFQNISIRFKDIEKYIIQKAINIKAKQENSIFQFEHLKERLQIKSIEDLIKSDFLGDFYINVILYKKVEYKDKDDKIIFRENVENKEKLIITMKFLENVFAELKDKNTYYCGG